jgi:hypothetical protein
MKILAFYSSLPKTDLNITSMLRLSTRIIYKKYPAALPEPGSHSVVEANWMPAPLSAARLASDYSIVLNSTTGAGEFT